MTRATALLQKLPRPRAGGLAGPGPGEQPLVHIGGCHHLAIAGHFLPRFQGRRDECAADFFARFSEGQRVAAFIASTIACVSTDTRVTRMNRSITFFL